MSEKPSTVPASGEVNAITGYSNQYEYAACSIYRRMMDETLEGVTVADKSAGIFDDLVLRANGEVQATQVKSQRDATYVSLNTELVNNALIKDIADAWSSLEAKYGEGKVRLRYIFPGLLSPNDHALANDGSVGARHSAAFADFVSRRDLAQADLDSSIWSEKLKELRTKTGLPAASFLRFIQKLELLDERELHKQKIQNFPPQEQPRIEAIRDLIPQLIKESDKKQDWSEKELITRLNWQTRLSHSKVHDFPVAADAQDNSATESRLLDAIAKHSRGYIALVGPPGTGKSTLLQRALFSTTEFSVSRYLAFLPDERAHLGRAEAGDFLNDLIHELRSAGFRGSRLKSDNLTGLRSELVRQLKEASEVYASSGRKTVIVVDGLDHVPREETPHESFLKELPSPDAIPEGVVFVLGTQSVDLGDLKPAIIQQAKSAERLVPIDPLPREAIFQMAKAATLPDFIDRQTIYDASKGHPLSARYFIEALKAASTKADAEKILSDEDGLGGSLEQIYERVWNKLNANAAAKDALGLLARAEAGLTPKQLAAASSDHAVEEVLRLARFLLLHTKGGRLSIFHNSFRLFIVAHTSTKFDQHDAELEKTFHRRLAAMAAAADSSDPQYWMRLRYTSRAGDEASVRAIAAPEYFRASLRAFRPANEVYVDLRLLYAAIKPTRDRRLLVRALLVSKEIEYRLEAVSQVDFVELFLELDDVELATKHALDIGSSGTGWLTLVDELWASGETARARQVFEANEPLETIFGGNGLNPNQELQEAYSWVERAHRFRSQDKLLALINSIPVDTTFGHDAEGVKSDLRYHLALGLVQDGKAQDVGPLVVKLGLDGKQANMLLIESALHEKDHAKALEKLNAAASAGEFGDLHQSWRRAVAIKAQQLGDESLPKRIAPTLRTPNLEGVEVDRESVENRSQALFETTVLSDLSGVAIPDAPTERRREPSAIMASTHAKVRELGLLRARVEKGGDLAGASAELRSIALFFANAAPDRGDFEGYRFHGAFAWFIRAAFKIATKLGPEALKDFVAFVDEKLSAGDNNLARSQSLRLEFASLVFERDHDKEQAKRRVLGAQSMERSNRTPHEAVEFRIDFAKAFNAVGLSEVAQTSLDAMHEDTFGYWLRAKKEPQYEFWTWSYLKGCEAVPTRIPDSAAQFGRFVLGMDHTEGDETARRVVGDLLLGAGLSPQISGALFTRLADSDLTTWAQLADSTFAAIAKHDPACAEAVLLAFSQLVVPFFDGDRDAALPIALAALSPEGRASSLRSIVDAANRWCPPSERAVLLELVTKEAPEIQSAVKGDLDDAKRRKAELVAATHGERSSEQGVSLDVAADSLNELLSKGDGKAEYGTGVDYSYGRAAERLAGSASIADLKNFLAQRPHIERDAKVMASFSARAWELGEKPFARELFVLAEAAAGSGHWSNFMGGEKKAVQQLRIKFEGDSGKEAGFDVLVDELAAGQTFGPSLFLNLDEVLEQVSVNPAYGDFWLETEEHLQQYREFRLAEPVLPRDDVTSHLELLALVVAASFDFSCPTILDRGRVASTLVAHVDQSGAFTRKLFFLLEAQKDGVREAAALMHRLVGEAHLRAVLLNEAKRLLSHPDFVVSMLADQTLHDLGETVEEPKFVNLPPFYSIVTAPSEQADDFDPPPGLAFGQRPVWTDDPWTWTAFLKVPLTVMRDASGISLDVLRRRTADFMRRDGGRATFGPDVDKSIESRLRRMVLQFTFNRPMPRAGMRAIGRVLQELALADAIDPRAFPVIWQEIGGPTRRRLNLAIERKPDWIALPEIPHRQHGGLEQEPWLARTEDCLHIPLAPDGFVLAEERIFKIRAWRDNAQSRRLVLPEPLNVADGVHNVPRLIWLDDQRPLYPEKDSKIVAHFTSDLFGDLREPTLTICPYVASRLRWERRQSDPLVLLDSAGEVVAGTIQWVDGTDRYSNYEAEVYARGQVLVLTPDGRRQLEGSYGPVRCQVRVRRRIDGESKQSGERVLVSDTPLLIAASKGS